MLNYLKERIKNSSRKRSAIREVHLADRLFVAFLRVPTFLILLVLSFIGFFLYRAGAPAFQKYGLAFLFGSIWDPVAGEFGVLPVILGTLMSSFSALLIATPISIAVALFLTEITPRKIGLVVGFGVEMLAAIPSVVYGLWGIFVLAPWLRKDLEPFLAAHFGFLPFFQGPPYGLGMLAAAIILAIMITPTMASITREIFAAIPQAQRHAALALGSTRWEMMRITVLRAARPGIIGAMLIALGRALGETMAVTMVIGNRHEISLSLFAPGSTLASIIANEYSEAVSDIHLSALGAIGFTLFGVTFIINILARLLIRRGGR